MIYDKIDKDGDNQVSEDELKNWIRYVQNRYITVDTDRQWAEYKTDENIIKWEDYKQRNYGFLTGIWFVTLIIVICL